MKMRVCLFSMVLLCIFALRIEAAPITSGIFSPAPVANEDGDPYWDNDSWDSDTGPCNIGALLGSNADCGANTSLGLSGLEYLNDGAGNAVSFGFENADGDFTYIFKITDYDTDNILGWRDLDNLLNTGVIFDGSDGPFDTVSVVLPSRFEFYYNPRPVDGTYYSTADASQFALFRDANGDYYLGIEDLLAGDDDYNDAKVMFAEASTPPTPVPEPASLLLVGSGVLVALRKRRSLKKAKG